MRVSGCCGVFSLLRNYRLAPQLLFCRRDFLAFVVAHIVLSHGHSGMSELVSGLDNIALDLALSVPAFARRSRSWNADLGMPAASTALSNRSRNMLAVIDLPSAAIISGVERTLRSALRALIHAISFISSPTSSIRCLTPFAPCLPPYLTTFDIALIHQAHIGDSLTCQIDQVHGILKPQLRPCRKQPSNASPRCIHPHSFL